MKNYKIETEPKKRSKISQRFLKTNRDVKAVSEKILSEKIENKGVKKFRSRNGFGSPRIKCYVNK